MSGRRRKFTNEYKVEAAHRVIDSGRPIAAVARELGIMEQSLGAWVRDERRRIEAAKGTGLEPLSGAERAELVRLRRQVAEQEKDLAFLGKAALSSRGRCNACLQDSCWGFESEGFSGSGVELVRERVEVGLAVQR